jgi:hypothetical protein
MRHWLACCCVGVLSAVAGLATGQPGKSTRQVPPPPKLDQAIQAALTGLRPDNPEGYYLLGEEVADGADDEARVGLAKSLFALAFELDRKRGSGSTLAAASAMALARIERLDRDKRWLVAIAGSVDRRYALPDWNVGASASISDETAYKAATAIGLTRSGDGKEARRLLDQPGVSEVLRKYERAIGSTGETGALSRLDKYMQAWPCPECGNSRSVTKVGEKGPEVRLCMTCRGNPGPRLDAEEYIAQLRFEAALLNGIQRSWAAQVVVDQGAPLRDPDLDELAPTYAVEASKAYWRDGAWVDTP